MSRLSKETFAQLLAVVETVAVELTVRNKYSDNSDLSMQLGLALTVLNRVSLELLE
jgi:hypothetical protein